ncbi:MAG: hypothetical protein GTN80_06525 [Nitrososphaeria archaeon]|nr:hypothetical protein [Nitrososphaeria archaeon]NIQ33282.1 hypothetical protein [Nitrososphaeria archaeon]
MALHPPTIHFHIVLVVNSIFIPLYYIISKIWGGDPRFITSRRDKRYSSLLLRLDAITYYGTFLGIIALVISGVTGFLDVGGFTTVHAFTRAEYLAFKISIGILAFQVYAGILFIRWRVGEDLWNYRGYRTLYILLALVGAGLITAISLYGGKMVYGPSILDPLLDILKSLGIPLP